MQPAEDLFITIRGEAQTGAVWMNYSAEMPVDESRMREINPEISQKLVNHSPDGFAWGYAGSGPSQLALAILLEITDKSTALRNYQRFKEIAITPLEPEKDFLLTNFRIVIEFWK